MRTVYVLSVSALFFLSACTPTATMTLKDVNPNRIYRGESSKVLDQARAYGAKEGFRIDKFDPEQGSVIGYKNYAADAGAMRSGGMRTILMRLKVTASSQLETFVNATFRHVEDQGTPTRQDEADLLECYHTFFEFMDAAFPAK